MAALRAPCGIRGARNNCVCHSPVARAVDKVNRDFRDFLAALHVAGARFLVVGAHALAVHGVPRATGDLDVWIDRAPENVARVWKALAMFGAPLSKLGVASADLESADVVLQLGLPPYRVDLLTGVTGLDFDSAWDRRVEAPFEDVSTVFLSREDLVQNKRQTGRVRDLADLEAMGEA